MNPLHAKLETISNRIRQTKERITTEEATKNAYIMPFIQALGYDIFDPLEVVPEYIADIGKKKGEKVDYCILKEGKPIIIIECKNWSEKLDVHTTQLERYFHTTKVKFAILTNGIDYRFFTDLSKPNVLDKKPFLSFDMTNLKEVTVGELSKFAKEVFDEEMIMERASDLKYLNALVTYLGEQTADPDDDFIKFFGNKVYEGKMTTKAIFALKPIISKAFSLFLNDAVQNRLQTAIDVKPKEEPVEEVEKSNGINTTEDEIEAFHLIKSMLRNDIDPSRISYRDTKSYFGVLLDDNNRKPICRLWLESNNWYIGIFDEKREIEKHKIEALNDIYNFNDQIKNTCESYN